MAYPCIKFVHKLTTKYMALGC